MTHAQPSFARWPFHSLAAFLFLAFATAIALPAGAEDAAESETGVSAQALARAERSRSILLEEAALREEWQGRYRTLLVGLRDALAEQEGARIDRALKRQDKRRRGEPRRASDQRIEDAASMRDAAREEIGDFYQGARAEGIERSWLVAVDDDFPDLVDELPDRD